MEPTGRHSMMMSGRHSVARDSWNVVVGVAATAVAGLVPAGLVLGYDPVPWFRTAYLAVALVFIVDALWRVQDASRAGEEWWMPGVDILAALPFGLIGGLGLLSSLQLLKLIRIARILHQWRLRHLGQWNALRLVYLGYWISLSVHWLASGWVALRGIPPGMDSWTAYLMAWYFTTTTLTTIGYGDITPVTNAEMMYAIAIMVFGVAMYSYVIANVATLIANLHPSRVRYLETMERLTAFMQYRRLPRDLQERIRAYHTYIWDQRLGYDESTFLAGLPAGLMTDVTLFLRRDVIQKVPFLHGASDDLLRDLTKAMKQVVVTPGEYVFRAGETGNEMFFISRGALEVIGPDGASILATLHEGDFFGEMALLLNRPRTASIRAVGYCDLYTLSKQVFDRIIAHHPGFAAHVQQMSRDRGGIPTVEEGGGAV